MLYARIQEEKKYATLSDYQLFRVGRFRPILGDPSSFLPGLAFVITDVSYSENDIPQNPASLIFSSDAGGGGFFLFDTFQGILSFGSQVYSGTEDTPTFLEGTYSLPDIFSGSDPNGTATLTIKSVPEPSSLMLLGMGMLALLGLALKKRSYSSITQRI